MGQLTPSDVKRWDLDAIHRVFETANGRANTLQQLGDNLQQVHNVLIGWQGQAGEAFRTDLGKARRDIDADGQESKQVAAAVSRAEKDVSACKRELDDIQRVADANGWTITPDWRIDVGDTWVGRDSLDFAAQQQVLQDKLIALKVHADSADHELATAIRSAVGEGPSLPAGRPAPQSAPKPAAEGQPRSLQDMLFPAGAADPASGDGPPSHAPAPAGGAGGNPPVPQGPSLPTGKQAVSGQGDQLTPGSLADLLGGVQGPVVPGTPPPALKPADVESFKAMARQTMIRDGVPPDQIEARLNDVVGRTQQWLDNGMPNYVPPEPQRPPPPGFGEGFSDRWFATDQAIKNLVGQGGPGAPSVLKSWEQMLKNTIETAPNPAVAAIGEVKNALDSPSPAYYLGGKAADGAFALPGLIFGGEGAAVEAGLGDIGPGVLDTGPVVSPHSPIGFDHPFGYNPWAEQAATDLNGAFGHGGPTPSLSRQLADMSTHYVGDHSDRVVLGRFDGQAGGYIGDARGHGGIYFDTGDPAWAALTRSLGHAEAQGLAWQVNEQFLRGHMEAGIARIEYNLPQGFNTVEEVLALRPDTFSAKEIAYLKSNGEEYGYQQVGNSWVHVAGGRR